MSSLSDKICAEESNVSEQATEIMGEVNTGRVIGKSHWLPPLEPLEIHAELIQTPHYYI
jgi:hypothetical protein